MQEPFFFLVGLGVGLATSAPVGPINIAAIQRALRSGFLAGFCAGLGAVFADGLYASFAAFGVTAVSDFVDENSVVIQTIGGLLVIVFGIRILLSRPHMEDDDTPSPSLMSGIATGFVMTATNPGVVLGFLAIFGSLGKWAPDPGDYVGAAMLVAGVLTGAVSWWVMLSALVSRLRLQMNDTWLVWINRSAGAALIAFGMAIFLHHYVLG